ncbi:unnamed protein product [Mytilus coruscus]|uniref:Uncharacterized protein n=1 Tax=Mytilus coruscus TaxID=42192 RepID=A0A6J8EFX2_MYTCO|nr:unnamed protein product [Mytilus coruscus]
MINGQYGRELAVYMPSSTDGITKTFQGEAYDCILKSPLSNCCIGDKNSKYAITTYLINYVTYQCISKSKAIRLFTQLSRYQLIKCLHKVIDENIGDDCIQCSMKNKASLKATKSLFLKCFADSVECSMGLGIPSKSVYNPEWVLCENCNWKDIYNYPVPKGDKKKLPKVMCAKRSNSVESICTLYEQN